MRRLLDTASFHALGTTCTLGITCTPLELAPARAAAAAARAEIAACERVLTRFDPDSDLSRLNAAPGWVAVDGRLVEAIEAAVRLERETGGRCTPFVLEPLTSAGYDRSFELLDVDHAGSSVRAPSRRAIDLGGTAKGLIATWALRAARRVWPALAGALVDLGGDVAVTGAPPEGCPWVIDVEDPRSGRSLLGVVRLVAGGIATSGPTRRRFGPGRRLHHLVDPVTGRPAVGGPLAATVVAADPVAADGHATALAITPIDEAAAYVARRPGLGAILVPEDGPTLVLGAVDFAARREVAV